MDRRAEVAGHKVFDLNGIEAAGPAGWMNGFLCERGPGGNVALADGLRLALRRWDGPLWLPVPGLIRAAGPEARRDYVMDARHWDERLAKLTAHLKSGDRLPPLIAQRRPAGLPVRDSNHRLGTL